MEGFTTPKVKQDLAKEIDLRHKFDEVINVVLQKTIPLFWKKWAAEFATIEWTFPPTVKDGHQEIPKLVSAALTITSSVFRSFA